MSSGIRDRIVKLPTSKIREVAELGMGQTDALPLWFGESDVPTPNFIKEAAKKGLDDNQTFYAPNNGLPILRNAIATYMSDLYKTDIKADRITVSASGMQAVMLTMQALVNEGDDVITVGPTWPNIPGAASVLGGTPREVCLRETNGSWHLDLDDLFKAITDKTKAIIINSPGNPTGWMMSSKDQFTVLNHCRKRGIWIVSDDVYARIVYDGRAAAPSFIEIANPEDRVIAINSFSKTWNMTGWRLGWITSPANIAKHYAMLTEFNIASAPPFIQLAGVEALQKGEGFIMQMKNDLQMKRDLVCHRLSQCSAVRVALPDAAFYVFFAVEGMTDSLATAKKILTDTNVGLAPGAAFGDNAEGYLRLCFATSTDLLTRALDRLIPFLESEFGKTNPVEIQKNDRKVAHASQ